MNASPSPGPADEVRHIFDRAVTMPPDERVGFLIEACKDHPDIEREVNSLLRHVDHPPDLALSLGLNVLTRVRQAFTREESTGGKGMRDPLIGTVVSHYEIKEKLGVGGMGVVYRAVDVKLGRMLALKFLPAAMSSDDTAKRRFVREARTASAIEHSNICTIYDIDETPDGRLFIAMAYVDGETLKQKIDRGRISITKAVEYALGAARALATAHEEGIVHRDIKPGNIMVSDTGVVKVLDFGLAKYLGGSQITRSGAVLGTISYMSPEQIEGEEVDHRTDLWSLGVVLYEMIAGRRPYDADYEQALAYSILNLEPTPLRELMPEVPSYVDTSIRKALQRDPERRFQNAKDMIKALEQHDRPVKSSSHWEHSILVLPFTDISPQRDNEYFSDGMTEELISGLSKIQSLRVICRTSAWNLKGRSTDITAIRKDLDVDYVLEGSVRKAGNKIRVGAQLIETESHASLWSGKYDGTLEDVFDIQDKVADAIVGSLKVQLTPAESERLSSRPIENIKAYECYLRARHEIWQWTEEALNNALQHLNNGLSIIGENALLHAGKGYVYWQFVNAGIKGDEYLDKAEEAAQRAYDLNRDSPYAHLVSGLVLARRSKLAEALGHLERAYEADSTNPDTLTWLIIVNSFVGNTREALTLSERLLRIDPLNPFTHGIPGWIHMLEGRFDLSLGAYERMYELAPDNPVHRLLYAQVLAYNDKLEEAYQMIDRLAQDIPEHPFTWLSLFFKHALQGEKEKARESMTPMLEAVAMSDLQYSWFVGSCYALLDEKDEALRWLENAVDRGFVHYSFLSDVDPYLENIRDDPRFIELMRTVRSERIKYVT